MNVCLDRQVYRQAQPLGRCSFIIPVTLVPWSDKLDHVIWWGLGSLRQPDDDHKMMVTRRQTHRS